MNTLRLVLRKLAGGIPLVLGVTLISFVLMVYYGPDLTYTLLSKNPTAEEIASVRAQLGYDRPFWWRYIDYLRELVTLDFGHSFSSGERVTSLLARTLPVSLALLAPGFVLGNLLGIAFGLLAAWHRGGWIDKLIMGFSVVGMSISFLVVIVAFQALFGVVLGWFPVRGWNVHDLPSYLYYVTVPTLASVFVALGYNTRFFRAVLVEELGRDHVRTARAFGAGPLSVMMKNVLMNAMIPIVTRVLFSIPLVVVSGSLLIESYFGIPGIGKATFEAITSGDQPVLKAVVGLTALLFVVILIAADVLYTWLDPRVSLDRAEAA
ncbi:ABC transporter permease [Wenzhouxiangella sp. XN79A]|uniref:ABC transporter permease n=1 Tax=Wenzhouxiangella sp. XN79A TaxID=2724193 RepID=UPI00144A5E9F|nr:ABC transporter permease [Wenzhouxiangella sp. XN79A]NKI34929.1 ABC transporter permease [Wenzhouxiangella sp. XN79A]